MRKGTYRAVHTSLWDDPGYEKLSPEARHVLLVLRLGTQSNLPCCYRLRLSVLSENTGYPLDTLCSPIAELKNEGWIQFDGVVVWIINGLKYDPQISLANPKHFENVLKVLSGLPKSQIVLNCCKHYSIDTHDIGYGEGFDTVSPPNPNPSPSPSPNPSPNPTPKPTLPSGGNGEPKKPPKSKPKNDPWDFTDKLASWQAAYPRIQVDQEVARCRAWWDANPEKVRGRKRPEGTVVNWLGRANERAPAVMDTDQAGNFWDGARWWTPDEYSASMNQRYIEDGISDATRAAMETRPWDKPKSGSGSVAQSAGGNPPVGGTQGADRAGGVLESSGGVGEVKGAGGLGA
jgi:hypothetical protein